ncbi:sodium-independent sulfate anion transporter-like isoform X2 [Paramacrobiotus metropolitanus]|uniref:sodium-independent sulfate anion transporter-like isoform X2 n=1 Tax=Paramacrobiotus metropolitanus TaxID=2943436 RepID=UPI002446236B|nr:sodium-independent sulfate anion transporter-like isoform X2 [Paramacrobiotus metropolitanus]
MLYAYSKFLASDSIRLQKNFATRTAISCAYARDYGSVNDIMFSVVGDPATANQRDVHVDKQAGSVPFREICRALSLSSLNIDDANEPDRTRTDEKADNSFGGGTPCENTIVVLESAGTSASSTAELESVRRRSSHSDNPSAELEWTLKSTEELVISAGDPLTFAAIKAILLRKCNMKAWRRRFPITLWLPKYSLRDFSGDIIAGVTLGLCVVPMSLAYAAIADVPLEYGLNAAFIGCFMYTIFGTAKDVSLGPTSLLALVTGVSMPAGITISERARYSILFCFFGGLFQLILGFLNLGFLINYISDPVISGFTTASAFLVVFSQVRTITGFRSVSSDNLLGMSTDFTVSKINGWDVLVGVISLSWLLLCSQGSRLPRTPQWKISYRTWQIVRKAIRIIAETRYVQVIVIATGVSYLLSVNGRNVLSVTREVRGGVPMLKMPEFAWGNHTVMETFLTALPGIPMIVLVGSLECIAVARALALHFHYRIDSTQEFVALGASNMCCAFFHGMPVSGSFARSAFKAQLGVRTTMGSTWTGVCVLFTITLFSPALNTTRIIIGYAHCQYFGFI